MTVKKPRGRPRMYKDHAEDQRAYRRRQKIKIEEQRLKIDDAMCTLNWLALEESINEVFRLLGIKPLPIRFKRSLT